MENKKIIKQARVLRNKRIAKQAASVSNKEIESKEPRVEVKNGVVKYNKPVPKSIKKIQGSAIAHTVGPLALAGRPVNRATLSSLVNKNSISKMPPAGCSGCKRKRGNA